MRSTTSARNPSGRLLLQSAPDGQLRDPCMRYNLDIKKGQGFGASWAFTQTSHKCHWAWCLVLSHLEQGLPIQNYDPNVCKNRSRVDWGGCNALKCLHPFDYCLLDNPKGTSFDDTLPPQSGSLPRLDLDHTLLPPQKRSL